jgi:5'-nucleotidase
VNPFEVLVDMDATAYDLTGPWMEWYNRESGDDLTTDDMTSWDWTTLVLPEWSTRIFDFLHLEGTFLNLKPFPGVVEAMREIHENGIPQYFATTCTTRTGAYEKQLAVERDFPFIGKENVLVTGGVKAFRGSVLFDDGPHNLEAFPNLTVKVNLHNSPYMKGVRADWEMSSWSQYAGIVWGAKYLTTSLE